MADPIKIQMTKTDKLKLAEAVIGLGIKKIVVGDEPVDPEEGTLYIY